jgi:hypothetical protein
MLREAYPRIKRVNPDAVVIAGVGGPTSSTAANRTSAEDWAKGVIRTGAPFDAYSQHVYPSRAPNKQTIVIPSWSNLGSFLDALDRVPRTRGKALYITEAGYTTAATEFRDVKVTPQQQAAYLNQIMRLPIVRSGRIPAIVWFNLRDNVFWPGGLLTEDFTPKPSYAVFSRLAARTPLHPQLRPAQTRFTLSARQLLINQRIFQTAVRRAAGLGASFDDRPMPAFGSGTGGTVRLTVGQLIVNQRIAQAAVRRADALASRLDEGERPVPRATPEPIPSALPAGGRIRFCGPITGDLGQAMQAWTILLTDGEFLGCDAATTILTDYYRQRPSDTPGSPPLVVDGATCNQYPKPDLPQVMCVRRGLPTFAAWPQT